MLWVDDPARQTSGWSRVQMAPAEAGRVGLAPGQEAVWRLAVRRADMAAGNSDGLYQSLLEVATAEGVTRQLIPVTARGWDASAGAGSRLRPAGGVGRHGTATELRPGLWVGYAVLRAVSQPAGALGDQPQPTGSEFQFRLLLHQDGLGNTRLLSKVLLVWQEGTLKSDPEDPTRRVVDVPGRYVLVTDEALAGQFPGASMVDGVLKGRRLSSAAFGFREPVPMTEGPPGYWQAAIVVGHDDPLNPFRHLHHPDHDNRDSQGALLGPGIESFEVRRLVELEFTEHDPENLTLAGWGDTQIGGVYREIMSGLHRDPIRVQGIFRLQRASRVATLNNEEAP
jgi:hypothetical protein